MTNNETYKFPKFEADDIQINISRGKSYDKRAV